jgi:hypothetical protein
MTVVQANRQPTGDISVTGAPALGQLLVASTGNLADADGLGTLSYQWLRDGAAIDGAASSSYRLVAADLGSAISLNVSYTDDSGEAEAVSSPATQKIVDFDKTEFVVTKSGASDYFIDDVADPELTLVRGQTYTFDIVGDGHPFYIKTALSAGTSDAYSDGVTNNGSSSGDTDITFTVGADAPDTLYYQCSAHYGMNGTINIVDAFEIPEVSADASVTYWQASASADSVIVAAKDLILSRVDGIEIAELVTTDASGIVNLDAYVSQTVNIVATVPGAVSGAVDLLDVLKMLDHISGNIDPLTQGAFVAADMDSNDTIDLLDALAVLKVISEETDASMVLVDDTYSRDIEITGDPIDLQAVIIGDVLGTYADML